MRNFDRELDEILARHREADRDDARLGYALLVLAGFWLGWFAHCLFGAGWFS